MSTLLIDKFIIGILPISLLDGVTVLLFFDSVDGVTVLLVPFLRNSRHFCFANLFLFALVSLWVTILVHFCCFRWTEKVIDTSWAGTPREVRLLLRLAFLGDATVGTFLWCVGFRQFENHCGLFILKSCVDTLVSGWSSGLGRRLGVSNNDKRERSLLLFG
jgi:hypothetical protein